MEVGPFRIPIPYVDLFSIIVGGRHLVNIVLTGGRLVDYVGLGTISIYVYGRTAPYLFRRRRGFGGTRKNKKKGGTKKDPQNYVLKPNEVAVITIDDPTERTIHKLEAHFGKPIKTINYDDLIDRVDQ